MNKKCQNCELNNFHTVENCVRCNFALGEITVESSATEKKQSLGFRILKRAAVCFGVVLFTVFGFYLSLIGTAETLSYEQATTVNNSIKILEDRGFSKEVFYLRYLTAFRASDHWLNASVVKEAAYAATNYPFEIMTLYPDFFNYPLDDVERAVILLHEAKHLQGEGEKEAYKFVWENRKKLGWTKERYGRSVVWKNVRKQTKEFAPTLFICKFSEFEDCTE
ncbi:MAG: hypothetical protein HKN25_01855 [Pyrinomonadaceae bacterium]|nr:hypothetical protein [Pyrinomonadaceae bacterium]